MSEPRSTPVNATDSTPASFNPSLISSSSSSSSAPTPIAFWITELNVGGAERAMVELVTRLSPERWRPEVYVLGVEPPVELCSDEVMSKPTSSFRQNALVERLRERGIPVSFLETRTICDVPRTLWRGVRLLRHQRPALVQSFLFHANILGCIASKLANVPRCFIGIRVAERRSRWYLRVERWIQRWVFQYVCVSRGVADFTMREGLIPAEKITVIPNGIDPMMASGHVNTIQKLSEINTCSDSRFLNLQYIPVRRLTMIGRLTYQKGLDWLLDALAELCRRQPTWQTSLQLRLIGAGEEEHSLRQQTVRLGLSECVLFDGWTANVEKVLAETDLLVLSSRWEGMPNVVLQAMRQAVPVLATEVEGVRELLDPRYLPDGTRVEESDDDSSQEISTDEENSDDSPQIVPFGDTDAWCTKCSQLLCNSDLARRLGTQNQERAERFFSLDAMVKRYEQLWIMADTSVR